MFVNFADTLEIQALACYQSEVQPIPHPRSPQAITAIARRLGSIASCEGAESFELVRLNQIVSHLKPCDILCPN